MSVLDDSEGMTCFLAATVSVAWPARGVGRLAQSVKQKREKETG
ncbi:hypothetical protein ATN83_0056 [Raoultella ornithinolytica]|nr:hypothetical protein ATN83_0056 [Raoultella ornithinolytica]